MLDSPTATTVYLRNCIPTAAIKEDNILWTMVWKKAYTHVLGPQRQKLDKESEKLHYNGFSIQSKGYRLLDETQNGGYKVRYNFMRSNHNTQLMWMYMRKLEAKHQQPQWQRQLPVRYGLDEYADIATTRLCPSCCIECLPIIEPRSLEQVLTTNSGKMLQIQNMNPSQRILLDVLVPSTLTFTITIFVKLCRMELSTYSAIHQKRW